MDPFSWTTLALVSTIVYLLYWYLIKPYGYWKKRGVPYVPATPILGSMMELLSNRAHEVERERVQKYGKVFGYYESTRPHLNVSDPKLIRDILVKDFSNFTGPRDLRTGSDILDDMLFSVHGEKWKRIRTIISPVFTTGKIKKVLPIIMESVKTVTKNFSDAAKKDGIVDMKNMFGAFAMDVIASAAFATKIDSHNDPSNPFVVHASKSFSSVFPWRFIMLVLFPALQKFFKVSFVDPEHSNFFKEATLQIIQQRKRTGEKRNDFIQLMMDASIENAAEDELEEDEKLTLKPTDVKNKVLSRDELVANCIMFFLVGYESSSSSLAFLTYSLALNPDIQEKLIKEIDETFKKHGKELPYEAIQNMTYLDMVVSESLRMYPIAVRTERKSEADYRLSDTGITIPKGMIVNIPIYAIHYNPEYFPNPEKFDPERFSSENKATREPYTYLPFSAGPRNCVGMRFALFDIKACITYVLSQYRVKKCPQTKVPPDYFFNQGLLQPKQVFLKVEPRTDKVVTL